MSERESQLNPVLLPITRLKICAALAAGGATEEKVRAEMRFAHLRDLIGVPDATLSEQLTILEEHGYISRFHEYGSTRAKNTVWVTLTTAGLAAFRGHAAALRSIAGEDNASG